jgi:hypothetical protein
MSKKRVRTRLDAEKRPSKKISPEARQLIRAALRQAKGSEREASRILKLKSHMHLWRMMRGEMNETPQMKAAVIRARLRARRAFLMVHDEAVSVSDIEKIRHIIGELDWTLQVAKNVIGG